MHSKCNTFLFRPGQVQTLEKMASQILPEQNYREETNLTLIAQRAIQYCSNLNKIFVSKGLKIAGSEDEDKEYYSLHKYTLGFRNIYVEKSYKMYLIEKIIKFVRIMFIISLVFYTI